MEKICIIGSQGSGKTTLAYRLAHDMKINHYDVSILAEVARSCPLPINEEVSDEAQFWIFGKQMTREQSMKGEILISDRSLLDPLVYGIRKNPDLFTQLIPFVKDYMKTYKHIIYLPPRDEYLIDDGIRSPNKEFRDEIDTIMKTLIDLMDIKTETYNEVYEQYIGGVKNRTK